MSEFCRTIFRPKSPLTFSIVMFDWASEPWKVCAILLLIPILAYFVIPFWRNKGTYRNQKTISLFVLGDLGHSPRTCYHARSFAKLEYFVNLCGYIETSPPADILDNPNIELHAIQAIKNTTQLPYLLFALKKVSLQVMQLVKLLHQFRGCEYVMIQNPPSVPILVLIIIYSNLLSRGTKIIVDWHNLNYSILNLRYNNLKHPVVQLVRQYERIFGYFAHINITVTRMMADFLTTEFGFDNLSMIVLHDRPASQFQPTIDPKKRLAILESHEIFQEVKELPHYKVLMSSTSFTPDEDFNILLDALSLYDQRNDVNLPPILLVVTGKGPLKNQFLQKVHSLAFSSKVIVKTAWLSSQDYPKILSVADLGVSLHSSSSGIDLPMKIVDFFGTGVPVISLKFPAICELVKHNENGMIVEQNDSVALLNCIVQAFTDEKLWDKIHTGAYAESLVRWDATWDAKMRDTFL